VTLSEEWSEAWFREACSQPLFKCSWQDSL